MIAAALLALAPLVLASCGNRLEWIPQVLLRDQSSGTVPIPAFSYGTITGPLNWHNLDKANFLCGNGTIQSPILLNSTSTVAPLGSINLNVPFAREVEFGNLGTTVEVVISGTLIAANQAWNLTQFHFHTPSEHRVDEGHYDAETHFVFAAADGSKRLAVLAFFIDVAAVATTPLLEHIFSHLDEIQDPGTSTKVHNLDFTEFQRAANSMRYYNYTGSLTTPPCLEGVLWFVSTTSIPLRVETYSRLKGTTKTNNRYTQNLLGQPNILKIAAAGLG